MKDVLRNCDLRIAIGGRALSILGDAMTMMALMLAIAASGDPARLTPVLIAFALPSFALAGLAGRLVDTRDSRHLLAGFGALQVLASIGLLLSDHLATQLVSILLLQTGQAVTAPTWGALLPRIVGEEAVGRAVGLQQTATAVAALLGTALAGVTYDHLGYRGTIAVDTVTFAVLIGAAFLIRTRRNGEASRPGAPIDAQLADHDSAHAEQGTQTRGGVWAVVRSDVVLRSLLAATGLFIVAAEGLNVVEVFLVTDTLGASGTVYGLLVALIGAGAVAAPLLAGRIDDERRRIVAMAAGLGAMGIAFAASGLVPSWVWLIPLFLVVGIGNGTANVLGYTLMIGRSPEAYRGRVLALVNGVSRGCSVLALALGGWAGQAFGAPRTFVIGGILACLTAPLVLLGLRGPNGASPSGPEELPVEGVGGAAVGQVVGLVLDPPADEPDSLEDGIAREVVAGRHR